MVGAVDPALNVVLFARVAAGAAGTRVAGPIAATGANRRLACTAPRSPAPAPGPRRHASRTVRC